LFSWILKEQGLKKGPHGGDRTFYSLRHTAITFRLIYGGNIDLLTLARNARTSVEMIEKFYASTLSAEMNISLLHSKRKCSLVTIKIYQSLNI
jgi:integrase